ncbi:unnamed protein product [Macrosiphum euphorbiae]|uniref:Uncharacterized protein n=1 Tax=Macrosiphum euphorbiae TaxID=13131 RepID=A0AAV0W8Y4_9HEMI|nr:unnamed protein product [Macrosiphum euphorbiae]
MRMTTSSTFVLTKSAFNGLCKEYLKKNTDGGSSYIPLPAFIERKKATINVLNFDEKCFKYSILAKLVNPVHAERIGSNYVEVENRYDFENINFPASLNDVAKFEKTNKVSVNIYSLKNGELKYKNNVKKIQKE